MRHDGTPAERRLWQALRKHQLRGRKFRRQVPLGTYIAEFYCAELRLVIELDGISHIGSADAHARRGAWMRTHGIRVLRFANAEVLGNLEGVIAAIGEFARTPPPPGPLPQGEGEHPYASPAVPHAHV